MQTNLSEHFTPLRDETSIFKSTPCCQFCSASDTTLLRCSACKVVRYCSKDHQVADRPKHVNVCKSIARCSARMDHEELKLRNQPDGDMFAPAHVFEKHVGHFWGMHNTRPYMRARYTLVEAILQVHTRDAVVAAYDHVMDCIRLCRADNLGLRDLLPALMLRLGKVQECYDFVKWHATTGRKGDYNWGDMKQPFLDIKDADMLELPNYLFEDLYPDLSHLVSITLLKIKLLVAVRAGSEGKEMLRSSPTFNRQIQDENGRDSHENGLKKVITILKSHVSFLYGAVNKANPHMWHALLSPQQHLKARPSLYTHGSVHEMQMVLKQNYDAWNESPEAIGILAATFHKIDYRLEIASTENLFR